MELHFHSNSRKYARMLHFDVQRVSIATYSIGIKFAREFLERCPCPVRLLVSKDCIVEAIHLQNELVKTDVEFYIHPESHIKLTLFEGENWQEAHLSSANFCGTDWAEFDIKVDNRYFRRCLAFFESLISSPLCTRL